MGQRTRFADRSRERRSRSPTRTCIFDIYSRTARSLPRSAAQNITAADIGDFFKSLGDDLKEVSVLKIVDVSGNRVGARNEDMEPIHKLLTASSNSLTALNLCGCENGQRNLYPSFGPRHVR